MSKWNCPHHQGICKDLVREKMSRFKKSKFKIQIQLFLVSKFKLGAGRSGKRQSLYEKREQISYAIVSPKELEFDNKLFL